MPTFITGATSSIGRVLVKSLAADGERMRILARPSSDRRGLDLPGVEFVYGDVTDADSVRSGMAGCEQVVHMAAVVGHQVPESEWWRVNRDGSRNVLQAAFDLGVKSMVQVSSLSVLGATAPGEVADERRPIDTSTYTNLYQKTKHAADEIAREFAAKGLPVKIVYPAFGYGCSWASSHPSMAETTLLRMAAGKPTAIMGSGTNRICMAYYKDTVQGIRLAHERGKAGDDYILGGPCPTWHEIWAAVAQVLGKQVPRRRVPLWLLKAVSETVRLVKGKPIFPSDFFDMVGCNWNLSSAKAQRELGWQPHTLLEGLTETWAEYQASGWKA